MSSSVVQPNNVQPTIFREYIGSKSYPRFPGFPDIINPGVKEFHFILAFATDETCTGNFSLMPSLSPFTPAIIESLKTSHSNAKVVISIGGRGQQCPFNTTEKDEWLDNAKKSLKKIIDGFKDSGGCFLIDGIDVTYGSIKSSENVFVECIGGLITSLREARYVQVVSIAPSVSVASQYNTLFRSYCQYIDWVDYQLYPQPLPNPHDFVKLYPKEKLLAGFSTDPSDGGKITLEDFVAFCRGLLKDKLLRGIFVWNANDSAVQAIPFHAEKVLQELLVEFN